VILTYPVRTGSHHFLGARHCFCSLPSPSHKPARKVPRYQYVTQILSILESAFWLKRKNNDDGVLEGERKKD
jgi:hypothetical protein